MNALRKRVMVVALFVPLAAAAAGPDELVHLEVHREPFENGRMLDMRVDEIERSPDASLVEVRFTSGGSVSSSMFVVGF